MKKFKDSDMHLLLGRVLRAGTVISICIVFLGGIIYLYGHGHTVANYKTFVGVPGFVQHFQGLIYGAVNF